MTIVFDNLAQEIPIEIIIPGYVLDINSLNRIDLAVQRVLSNIENYSKDELVLLCTVTTLPDKKHKLTSKILKFSSIKDLNDYFDTELLTIKNLLLEYLLPTSSITLNFGHEGIIKGSAIGSGRYFAQDVYYWLIRELEFCEQSYDWVENNLLRETKNHWVIFSLASFTALLSVLFNYFFHISNMSPDLSYRILHHTDELKLALSSESIDQKLDAIIISLIRQSNSPIAIDSNLFSYNILIAAILLIITSVIFILSNNKRRDLYPKAFFNFGRNKSKLEKIINDRDFWKNTVIVSLLINILASVAIAIVS